MAAATHQPPVDPDLSLRADPRDRPDLRRRSWAGPVAVGVVVLLLGAAAAWYWWPRPAPAPVAPPAPVTVQEPVVPAPAPAPTASVQQFPAPAAEPQPLRTSPEVVTALQSLLGAKALSTFFLTDNFVRRAVATLDNLGRDHAPPAVWPFKPTPGQFQVDAGNPGEASLADANAQRYGPWITMAESVDPAAAVGLYRRMYPLLQQTYRELGFGDRSFHERVIEVIDLLLASPEPAQAPKLTLPQVKGPYPFERPWQHYEYADPQLESLAAGQKIMVRMGVTNERRVKAILRKFRHQLVAR